MLLLILAQEEVVAALTPILLNEEPLVEMVPME